MTAIDEDNYKEAIETSFKVFTHPGISKFMLFKLWLKLFRTFLVEEPVAYGNFQDRKIGCH